MSGTYSASTVGVKVWVSPSLASTGRASGSASSLSSSSASSPITTTIRGLTIAISCATRARHSAADMSVSGTGHLTNSVP
jgi:hypothetical protein